MRYLLLLGLLLTSQQSFAATWYACPTGSGLGDTDGSSAANCYNGFSDITWGVGGVQAGDTLRVLNNYGTYYERLSIGQSGSSGSVITITGWNGITSAADYATVESTVAIDGDQSFSAATTYATTGYAWTLVSGEVYKKSSSAIPHNLFEDGVYLTPILGYGSSEGTIAAALARGQYSVLPGTPDTIYYRASNGAAPSTHSVRMTDHRNDGNSGNVSCSGRDYLDIRYFTIKGAFPLSVGTTGAAGLALNDCENITVDYIKSTLNLAGLSIDGGINVTLGSNVNSFYNFAVGLTMEATPVAITNATVSGSYTMSNKMPVYTTNAQAVGYSYDGDCIGVGEGGGTFTNIVIDGVTAAYCGAPDSDTDQGGSGIYVGSASAMSASVSIKRSYIHHNHGCGIHLGDEWTGGLVLGNLIQYNVRGQTTGTCLFNFWVDTTSTGGTWLGATIANNTIDNNFGSRAISFNNATGANTITFKNNIFSNNASGFGSGTKLADVVIGTSANDNILEANNDVYSTSVAAFYRGSARTCAQVTDGTWGAVSSNTGDNTVCVDPKYVGTGDLSLSKSQLKLKPSSTLIGAGAYLNIGSYQDVGNRAFRPKPNIGAWEQTSGDDVPTARTARN